MFHLNWLVSLHEAAMILAVRLCRIIFFNIEGILKRNNFPWWVYILMPCCFVFLAHTWSIRGDWNKKSVWWPQKGQSHQNQSWTLCMEFFRYSWTLHFDSTNYIYLCFYLWLTRRFCLFNPKHKFIIYWDLVISHFASRFHWIKKFHFHWLRSPVFKMRWVMSGTYEKTSRICLKGNSGGLFLKDSLR